MSDDLTRSVILERLDWAAKRYLPQTLLDHITVERIPDLIGGGLIYMLRASIWAQRLDEQVVRYPADWWQAFKQRFFPYWARQRWPVRETVKAMRLYAWYPDLMIPSQRSQYVIEIRSDGQA